MNSRVENTGRSIDGIKEALAAFPVDLGRLIDGKTRERLTLPAQDGGWGMVEIIPHLRDWEEVTHDRVWTILDHDHPTLEDFDDSLWAIEHEYSSLDPVKMLDQLRALRQTLVDRLDELADEDWQRTATFTKQGTITLLWLMNRMCDHDARHLVQARDVLA